MTAVNNQPGAIFDSYDESFDSDGYLVLTAVYQGQFQKQTMLNPAAVSALYFDTSNISFSFVTDLTQLSPTMLYIKTVQSVA